MPHKSFLKLFLTFSLLFSCSYLNKNKDETEVSSSLTLDEKIHQQEEAFFKKNNNSFHTHMPECNGCIAGSSPSDKDDFDSYKPVYHLETVAGYKLENQYFDFPVVDNQYVRTWVKYFTGRGRSWFVRSAERAGRYAPMLSEILTENGMPRDLIYLSMAESGFNNNALSHALAAGPWQFIASTGKKYGLHIGWYVDERLDPIKASFASSRYLKDLYGLFQSWELAAAAYNAGEGRVMRATRRYRTKDFWKIRRRRYLRRETRNYVPKIMALAIIGKNLKTFGFEREVEFQKPLEYEVVHVGERTDLYKLAADMGTSFKELRKWNPELKRWETPAARSYYPLRVPVGSRDKFESCCSKKNYATTDYQKYKIKSYGNISLLSKKFKVPKNVLAELNGVPLNKSFKKGEFVTIPFYKSHSRRGAMYRDLYVRRRRRGRRRASFRRRIAMAKKYGQTITNPSQFYTVRRGDTLWDVAKKTGTSLNTIIKSNLGKVRNGMIQPGQKLVVK